MDSLAVKMVLVELPASTALSRCSDMIYPRSTKGYSSNVSSDIARCKASDMSRRKPDRLSTECHFQTIDIHLRSWFVLSSAFFHADIQEALAIMKWQVRLRNRQFAEEVLSATVSLFDDWQIRHSV